MWAAKSSPKGRGLVGTTLRYPYEVRDEKRYFEDIPELKLPKEMGYKRCVEAVYVQCVSARQIGDFVLRDESCTLSEPIGRDHLPARRPL